MLNRRDFLKITTVAATAASLGMLGGCGSSSDGDNTEVSAEHFPQSVVSGDPKSDSVILWTRLAGDTLGGGSHKITLIAASDKELKNTVASHDLTVTAEHDYCTKVKLTGLQPGSFYYYRFHYDKNGKRYTTRTARTKTAPASDADVPVKFTFLSCQDYIGRYYNSLAYHLQHVTDIDFVVHLGDYIYETTGDPSFQNITDTRKITFTDTAGAVALGTDQPYYGAASVSNYREIYKKYRTDSVLQRFHELYPIIAIWDDHEFSDDCWGATATYFDEKKDEFDTIRRMNSEQAFYEFLPVDNTASEGAFQTPDSQLYGQINNAGVYRDFRFGKHLHLILSDYRTFRPDHLIPEGAFPGKVVLDKAAITAVFEAQYPGQGAAVYELQKAAFGPYVDMTSAPWNAYSAALVPTLTYVYMQEGLSQTDAGIKAAADLNGLVSAYVFNALVTAYNSAVTAENQLPLIDDNTYNNVLDRGIAYMHIGKQGYFSDIGSRYGVVKATYDMLAGYKAMADVLAAKTPENVFGDTQLAWLTNKISTSSATNICFGSSVSTTSLIWDMTALDIPADYKQRFYANVDHWDGFPNRKNMLLEQLGASGKRAFVISGDIHASFVTDHPTSGANVADFTGTSVSSSTFINMVEHAVEAVLAAGAFTDDQKTAVRAKLITNLDDSLLEAFDPMIFADTARNGFVTVTVTEDNVTADYYLTERDDVFESFYKKMNELTVTHKKFVFDGTQVAEEQS